MSPTKPVSLLHGKRFWIVAFLFFNVVINYIDRVNLSIAAPVIAKHFHWDAATMGWIFAGYLWTYAACLLPSGWLADRFGARHVGAIAIFIWSAAAMLTGAVTNFASMILARLGLGDSRPGERAFLGPGDRAFLGESFDPSDRGRQPGRVQSFPRAWGESQGKCPGGRSSASHGGQAWADGDG